MGALTGTRAVSVAVGNTEMKFSLNIDSANEGMCSPLSVALALRVVATKIINDRTSGTVADDNGNSVGTWSLDAEKSDDDDE